MQKRARVLDLEKFRMVHTLRNMGYDWIEDQSGKVRVWMKLRNAPSANKHPVSYQMNSAAKNNPGNG